MMVIPVKPKGRPRQITQDEIDAWANDYFTTDLGYVRIARKYKRSPETVHKYLKPIVDAAKAEENNGE